MVMKRIVPVLCAAAVALLIGCDFFPLVQGSGYLTTSTYNFTDFSTITATHACRVHVVPDAVYSLRVTSDDNLLPYMDVRRNGAGSVLIGLAQGYNYHGITFNAEVHMPVLVGLDLSGASEARVDTGFASTQSLEVTLSGAGFADIKGLSCAAVNADLSGASSLSIGGTTGSETVIVSGASTANLLACAATRATVAVSGASEAWINANQISLSASGASTLYYIGSPLIQTNNLSGASVLVKVY
jgi:hypothetical protein